MTIPKDEGDNDVNLVYKAAQALGEQFDAVHIFASRDEPTTEKGTVRVDAGCGNWYARYGQISQWLLVQDAVAEQEALDDMEEED